MVLRGLSSSPSEAPQQLWRCERRLQHRGPPCRAPTFWCVSLLCEQQLPTAAEFLSTPVAWRRCTGTRCAALAGGGAEKNRGGLGGGLGGRQQRFAAASDKVLRTERLVAEDLQTREKNLHAGTGKESGDRREFSANHI